MRQTKIQDYLPAQKLPGNTKPATRLRNACFTINNPTVTREALCSDLVTSGLITYVVIGSEIGESGTPHLQGYVEFKDKVGFDKVHSMLLNGHIEARKGSAQQASAYCMKDGQFDQWGKLSKQGARTDIELVADMVVGKASTYLIASEFPVQFIKYHKGISALMSALIQPRSTVPTVHVYYGITGSGKSYHARKWLPNAYVWHPQQGSWFDGYQGEEEVIFEEFRGQLPFGMLLSLLDRYCCKIQYKGGVCEFAATKIAFTSPKPFTEWYYDDGNDRIDQLARRVSYVECTTNGGSITYDQGLG